MNLQHGPQTLVICNTYGIASGQSLSLGTLRTTVRQSVSFLWVSLPFEAPCHDKRTPLGVFLNRADTANLPSFSLGPVLNGIQGVSTGRQEAQEKLRKRADCEYLHHQRTFLPRMETERPVTSRTMSQPHTHSP